MYKLLINISNPIWTRDELAEYWDCPKSTLNVWDCTGRYDLNPQKTGRTVYYFQSSIERLMGRPIVSRKPLLRIVKAASYIDCAPSSLASPVFREKHGLMPISIGGLRRFCPAQLDQYLDQQQNPY